MKAQEARSIKRKTLKNIDDVFKQIKIMASYGFTNTFIGDEYSGNLSKLEKDLKKLGFRTFHCENNWVDIEWY